MSVLLDTKALWGLIVKGSAYSDHVYEIAGKHTLLIPIPAIIEAWMAIYKTFSEKGKNFERGINALKLAQEKLKNIIEKPELFGVSVKVIAVSINDLMRAFEIICEKPDLFVKKGPKQTLWIRFFDAIIAAIWERTRAVLLTDDNEILKYGKEKGLSAIKLEKRKIQSKSKNEM